MMHLVEAIAKRVSGKYTNVFPEYPEIGKITSFLESKGFDSSDYVKGSDFADIVKNMIRSCRTGFIRKKHKKKYIVDEKREWLILYDDNRPEYVWKINFVHFGLYPYSKFKYDGNLMVRTAWERNRYLDFIDEICKYFDW